MKNITDMDDRTVSVSRDAAGRITAVTDDISRVTTLIQDNENRITERKQLGIDGTVLRSLALIQQDNDTLHEFYRYHSPCSTNHIHKWLQ